MSLVIQLGVPIECAPLNLAVLETSQAKNEDFSLEQNGLTVTDRDTLEKWLAQDNDRKLTLVWPHAYTFISTRLATGQPLNEILNQWRTLGENALALFRHHRGQVTLQGDNRDIEELPSLYKISASQLVANDEFVQKTLVYLEASSATKSEPKAVDLQKIEEALSEANDLYHKFKEAKKKNIELASEFDSCQDENQLLLKQLYSTQAMLETEREKVIAAELLSQNNSVKEENEQLIKQLGNKKEILNQYDIVKEENELLLAQLDIVQKSLQEANENKELKIESQQALTRCNNINKWLRVYASRYVAVTYRCSRRYKKLLKQQITLMDNSTYFDASWYREKYSDVAKANINPAEHYIKFGALEGRNPGPLFDTQFYLMNYPDVAASGQNPLLHYLCNGMKEQRKTQEVQR